MGEGRGLHGQPDSLGRVACLLCPHACVLGDGELGRCRARTARDGKAVPLGYGKITCLALDPVEKKPLAMFCPGSYVLSVGGFGCNMSCPFCQNASIAQAGEGDVVWRYASPEELVAKALDFRKEGCIGIAYTYNEPVVSFEFMRDTAQLAHRLGLKNVMVSNGMINQGLLSQLDGLIDAANIDLKGFSQSFYRLCGGSYTAVCDTIEHLAKLDSCHLEVTTLLVPGSTTIRTRLGAQLAGWQRLTITSSTISRASSHGIAWPTVRRRLFRRWRRLAAQLQSICSMLC